MKEKIHININSITCLSVLNINWKIIFKKIILVFLLGLILLQISGTAVGKKANKDDVFPDDPKLLYLESGNLYRKDQFEKSLQGYKILINKGYGTGHVYYNMGNCYLKTGKLGKAVQHYIKAFDLIPRDADLKTNLEYARTLVVDKIETKDNTQLLQVVFFWYYKLNFKELLWASLISNILLWGFGAILIYNKKDLYRWLCFVGVVFTLAFGTAALVKGINIYNEKRGIVLTTQLSVRVGISESSTALFRLREGSEVEITEQQENWLQIKIPSDNKRGWVPKQFIGKISDLK